MCVGNSKHGASKYRKVIVSILVLLDVCREYREEGVDKEVEESFNPCFVGCVSGIIAIGSN